jgi:3-deoxy-D-arabino-heptulosonate 7-phosphate (DAHP) synthase
MSGQLLPSQSVQVVAGAQFLHRGAYKPRTSPCAFQGHGESALGLLALAREATALGSISYSVLMYKALQRSADGASTNSTTKFTRICS